MTDRGHTGPAIGHMTAMARDRSWSRKRSWQPGQSRWDRGVVVLPAIAATLG